MQRQVVHEIPSVVSDATAVSGWVNVMPFHKNRGTDFVQIEFSLELFWGAELQNSDLKKYEQYD